MHRLYKHILYIGVVAAVGFGGCARKEKALPEIGHTGGPLLAALYAAQESPAWKGSFETNQFGEPSALVYALLSGDVSAGFVDPAAVVELKKKGQFDRLEILGKVSFQYGCTVVISKKISSRFDSTIAGLRVGVSSETCNLYQSFANEAKSRGIDASTFRLSVIPFHTQVIALQAGAVDLIVTKPAYAAVAAGLGHRVIYRNYDVPPADTCCPITLNQVALVLVAQKKDHGKIARLVDLLKKVEDTTSRAELRKAVNRETGISDEVLDKFPLPVFEDADEKLLHSLTEDHD